jgi:YHS domain-containing protein
MKSKKTWIIGAIIIAIVGLFIMRSVDREIVQVHNQQCPVTGSPVNGRDTYVYEGKKYNLCNEKCKKPLSENPKKYLCD